MNALAGFELHVLEQKFFIAYRWRGGYAQQIAQLFQVGPQFALPLPARIADLCLQARRRGFGS